MSESPQPTVFLNKRKSTGGAKTSSPLSAKGLIRKDVNKRWLYVGGALVTAIAVAAVTLAPEKTERVRRKAPEQRISVTPPQADKASFEQLFQKEMQGLQQEVKKLKNNEQRLTDTVANLRQELDEKSAKALEEQKKNAAGGMTGSAVTPPKLGGGGLTLIGSNGGPPAPPVPVGTIPGTPVGANGQFVPPGLGGAPQLPPAIPKAPAAKPIAPVMYDAPVGATVTVSPEAEAAKKDKGTRDSTKAQERGYQKNTKAGMMPAGSFASVAMFNGLDAGTSTTTQSNPMPVLMNIQDQATLPGSATYKIRNCFALGNGYGDLSAERVYIRVNRISCMDTKDQMVLSQDVQGYLVDSDGKLGLRGVIYNRQGALLGKSMLAGFAQGLASALGSAQSTVSSSLTTGLTSSSISGGAAIRASGLQGAQMATAQLAEFYLKEAQNIFPVISIDAGRTATVVFTSDAVLEWSSAVDRFVADERKPSK